MEISLGMHVCHISIFFYAIEHVNIFNSSFLDYGIRETIEDESVMKTDLARILFTKTRKLPLFVNELIENF